MNSPMVPRERFSRKNLLRLADRLILPAIVVLVGIGSFGLGRLSGFEEKKGALIIHPPGDIRAKAEPTPWVDTSVSSSASNTATDWPHNFLASKNGTKYYLPSCAGAKKIAVQNQVWFGSAEEAAAAGFEPAANCKGP